MFRAQVLTLRLQIEMSCRFGATILSIGRTTPRKILVRTSQR